MHHESPQIQCSSELLFIQSPSDIFPPQPFAIDEVQPLSEEDLVVRVVTGLDFVPAASKPNLAIFNHFSSRCCALEWDDHSIGLWFLTTVIPQLLYQSVRRGIFYFRNVQLSSPIRQICILDPNTPFFCIECTIKKTLRRFIAFFWYDPSTPLILPDLICGDSTVYIIIVSYYFRVLSHIR